MEPRAQPRTLRQNKLDRDLAEQLGISKRVEFVTGRTPRELMPFLLSACDIYAAPSRLEGFGMPQVEAGQAGEWDVGAIGTVPCLFAGVKYKQPLIAISNDESVTNNLMVRPDAFSTWLKDPKKDLKGKTFLVSTIAMVELMRSADQLFNTYFNITALVLAAFVYLVFTSIFTVAFERIEAWAGVYEKR